MNKKNTLAAFIIIGILITLVIVFFPNYKSAKGNRDKAEFFDAVRTKDPALMKRLALKNPSLVKETWRNPGKNSLSFTPLQLAAEKGNIEAIRFLVSQGADINGITVDNPETPLAIAAKKRKSAAVRNLIDLGAKINVKGEEGKNLLTLALQENNQKLIQLLESKNIDMNLALMWAWKTRKVNIMNFLIEKKADPKTTLGWKPVHFAAYRGDFRQVENMVQDENQLDLQDKAGRTPLGIAILSGNTDIAKFLIEHGAKTDNDKYEENPLFFAVLAGDHEITKILIDKGADVKMKSKHCDSLLHTAAAKGDVKTAEMLIEGGAEVNVKGLCNSYPLHNAVNQNHKKMVEFLLSKGANINALEGCNSTALHSAAIKGNGEMVKLLISRGADMNIENSCGETPMEAAICHKKDRIVEIFIDNGGVPKGVQFY